MVTGTGTGTAHAGLGGRAVPCAVLAGKALLLLLLLPDLREAFTGLAASIINSVILWSRSGP